MNFDKLVGGLAQTGDPGAYLAKELEQGLEPITKRVDALEKKLDLIILTRGRLEAGLKAVKPLVDFISSFPKPKFFK